MITRIKVKNFKSLEDFELRNLSAFTCLIGLNGAGKTTLLQFFDFVRSLLQGRVSEWLAKHKWNISDIITIGSGKRSIEFEFDVISGDTTETWSARFNTQEMRCTYESLLSTSNGQKKQLLLFEDNKLKLSEQNFDLPQNFKQEGSVFSFLQPLPLTPEVLLHTRAFGVLDPSEIAQASQTKYKSKLIEVESNGKGLVGFISSLPTARQLELFQKLQQFYPAAQNYKIRKQTFGWKNLLLSEMEKAYFDASHLSYGTLRLLVFLSQYYSDNHCLFFDEIENGINQELIDKLLEQLQNFNHKQVMVTTHSALVLNYLTDETAKDSVIFLYKDNAGHTHAKKFFEIEGMAKKLEVLGPGEVMSDTNLIDLSRQMAEQEVRK